MKVQPAHSCCLIWGQQDKSNEDQDDDIYHDHDVDDEQEDDDEDAAGEFEKGLKTAATHPKVKRMNEDQEIDFMVILWWSWQ